MSPGRGVNACPGDIRAQLMRYHLLSIRHHPLKRIAAVLLTVALLSGCAPVRTLPTLVGALARPLAQTDVPAYTNPVFDRDFPDPFVLPTEDGYYAYATNTAGRHVQVIYSRDLFTWERAGRDGDALPKLPEWAKSNGTHTWAPSVLRRGDAYILYYVARWQEAGRQCISYAVADAPDGPFVDPNTQPFICQLDEGARSIQSPL